MTTTKPHPGSYPPQDDGSPQGQDAMASTEGLFLPRDYFAVESSQIKAIAYFDNETGDSRLSLSKQIRLNLDEREDHGLEVSLCSSGRLEILFNRAADERNRWAYHEVPSWVVQEMLEADSLGSYFSRRIRSMSEVYKASPIADAGHQGKEKG